MRAPLLIALALFASPVLSSANFKGNPDFTSEQISRHQANLGPMMENAAACLETDLDRHKRFIKKYGISAFYGDNSDFARRKLPDGKYVATTKDEKRQMLREADIDEDFLNELIPEGDCTVNECPYMMQPTSCISLALKCLKSGFIATGQEDIWLKLRAYNLANGVRGDVLQDGLQKLGWKILYWNPDTSQNQQWDLDDQKEYPGNPQNIWGQHQATWTSVMNRQRYYYNVVDDYTSMVNFGDRQPRFFRDIPFFVGIAHIGYHVFPGTYGEIMEGHSARDVTDKHTIEKSDFNPLKRKGGPRGGPYKSGIVAIPPGYIN